MLVKDPCKNCGSSEYRFWRLRVYERKGETFQTEECSECKSVKPSYPRDAAGNKVLVSSEILGKYSYAIDAPITGQRQLAEHCKRHNLVQKG